MHRFRYNSWVIIVVLFRSILLSRSKTICQSYHSFPGLYNKRSNQKALQFWRMVNSLKKWKTSKGVKKKRAVFWYPSARPRAFARFAQWLIRPCLSDVVAVLASTIVYDRGLQPAARGAHAIQQMGFLCRSLVLDSLCETKARPAV